MIADVNLKCPMSRLDPEAEGGPEDFETVRQLLGHSFGKTTQIYAGLSGERASRAFGDIVIAKMEALDQQASRKVRRKRQNR